MKSQQPRTRWRWKFLSFYAVFLFILMVAVACIFEIGVRIFVPEKYWRYHAIEDDWQADPQIGWVNKANLDTESCQDGKTFVRFRTNKDGLQPASAIGEKTRFRIMLFGDSTVVGRPLPEEQRLAPQLERVLASKGLDCEVICVGVQGYSTDQELLLMRRLLPRYKPDVAVNMVCDNDFGGNESELAYNLPKPIFILDASGMLNLHEPAKDAMAEVWERGAHQPVNVLVQRIAIYRLVQPGLQHVRAKTSGWQQQNLIGVLGGDNFETSITNANWPLFEAMVSAMKAVCKENGAAFVLTQHPSVSEVWDGHLSSEKRYILQERLARAATKVDSNFCPVISFFLGARAEGPFHLLPRDGHCNAKGYEVTARCLANYFEKTGIVPERRTGKPK